MQVWTFSKHHTFKYDLWEKTQYSNMNFGCYLVTPAQFSEWHDLTTAFKVRLTQNDPGHPDNEWG